MHTRAADARLFTRNLAQYLENHTWSLYKKWLVKQALTCFPSHPWLEDGDDGDTDDDYDRRALLSTFEELALEARETKNALTEEEESLVNNLANLDDSTLKDLMDNIELLADDSEMSARSAKAKVASNLLIRLVFCTMIHKHVSPNFQLGKIQDNPALLQKLTRI